MKKNTDDRRTRRTKAQLRQALTELLREKPLDSITVTELTRRADVNRGTFYGHYKDIYDMVDQLEEDILAEFAALIDAYSATELKKGLRPILEDIFQFIRRNLDVTSSLLNFPRRSAFLEKFKSVILYKVSLEWNGLYHFADSTQLEHCLSFLVGGVVGLLQRWLTGGGRETPQEMAALAETLILQGIQPLVRS